MDLGGGPAAPRGVTPTDTSTRRAAIDTGARTFGSKTSGFANPFGIDLNRNYAFMWGMGGGSGNMYASDYRGPQAFSEPESKVVRDLIEAHEFTTLVSYHSYKQCILYPWSYSRDPAPDEALLRSLAERMAELMRASTARNTSRPRRSAASTTRRAASGLGAGDDVALAAEPQAPPDQRERGGNGCLRPGSRGRLASIGSSEPDDSTGDGSTRDDVQGAAIGSDDRAFELRAERRGSGNGRTYTIIYEAEDGSGNVTAAVAGVSAARSQGP